MPKRRRTSSISTGVDDTAEDSNVSFASESGSIKSKRRKYDTSESCRDLYELLRNHKVDDGRVLCEPFIRAPKRRNSPDYYDLVSNPIDMMKIQQKLRTDEYESVDDLCQDVLLMVNNAKAYYKKSSQEYKDAAELWEVCQEARKKLPDDDSKSDCDTDDDPYEELFTVVMTSTDGEGRSFHPAFQLLPSRKLYPEYFEVIDNPIDLKMIATKIQNKEYSSLDDLEKDLSLMTRNACLFNEPGSQIYKDAKYLKKLIGSKKQEIESSKPTQSKANDKSKSKRVKSLSATVAALQDEEEEDDSDESDDEIAKDSQQGQLYNSVATYMSTTGQKLSEPFKKLPSRRLYPDYYEEIPNPISLSQIKKKIKKGEYGTVSEVAGDLNTMFENAKSYNRPDSKLFKSQNGSDDQLKKKRGPGRPPKKRKETSDESDVESNPGSSLREDAMKLQRVMQNKVQEILEVDDSDSGEDDFEDQKTPMRNKPGRKPGSTIKKRKDEKVDAEMMLKKRMRLLYKMLMEYQDENGRRLCLAFMERPSKKLYPDYYQVISEPIDMLMIEQYMKAEKYQSEDELVNDFKLMFNNCKLYNEEGSVIYGDAEQLEKVLVDKLKELGPLPDVRRIKRTKNVKNTEAWKKMQGLYETIRDYKDPRGRQLSLIFMKLPSKMDYPDYYEIIKNPIDMERIYQKMKNTQYDSVEGILSDFLLMFDNACKYNEPDSQIYKDALILQRIALEAKAQLGVSGGGPPDIPTTVQNLLLSLFTATYNHQDEEQRCYSDSMAELPEHEEGLDSKNSFRVRAFSLDIMKRLLDKGHYKRLDHFQEDMFQIFTRARRLSRTDSQVFEDAVELQSFFIRHRDELCKSMEAGILQSPALSYNQVDLQNEAEAIRQEKLPQEQVENDLAESEKNNDMSLNTSGEGSFVWNGQVYTAGDFVYTEPRERGMEPHIVLISRLFSDKNASPMIHGLAFHRPEETFHTTTRRFLEKEVFYTELQVDLPLNQVVGRCHVMLVKDYFKMKPEGIPDKDVYVCESRYSTRHRHFKKVKIWNVTTPSHIKIVPRETILEPRRVISVFRERVEKHKEEIAELDEFERRQERVLPNIPLESRDGNTYWEQYNLPSGVVKLGDCVYVRSEAGRNLIAHIQSMWTTKDGCAYFHGPWFVNPSEVANMSTKPQFKNELYLSSIEDSNPLLAVTGRCAVLECKDYTAVRPTEIPEKDVYVCESLFEESKRLVRKLSPGGLKTFQLSSNTTPDELFYFRKPLPLPREGVIIPASMSSPMQSQLRARLTGTGEGAAAAATASTPVMNKPMSDVEDSLDKPPTPVFSDSGSTPLMKRDKNQSRISQKKRLTGYIVYSGEVRKSIVAKNPEMGYGEISRIIGNGWRNLPDPTKKEFEDRAQLLNDEAGRQSAASSPVPAMAIVDSPSNSMSQTAPSTPAAASSPGPSTRDPAHLTLECGWDACDFQFEDKVDLTEHCLQEPTGHVWHQAREGEFSCLWRNCGRIKKGVGSFPNFTRLLRHVKEVHIHKLVARYIAPADRSNNYVPSRTHVMNYNSSSSTPLPSLAHATPPTPSVVQQIVTSSTPTQSFQQPPPAAAAAAAAAVAPAAVASTPATPAAPVVVSRPAEPIFVGPPPKPTRVLHSEAYIRYIEGLTSESRHVVDWSKTLHATPDNPPAPDPARLNSVAQWLGGKSNDPSTVISTLWDLREFMMRDTFRLSKGVCG